jgi:hypothetical protein
VNDNGAREVAVLVRGSTRLRDNLLSARAGGKSDAGISEIVQDRYPGTTVRTVFEECGGAGTFLAALGSDAQQGFPTSIRRETPDILVLSTDADLEHADVPWDDGGFADRVVSDMLAAIRIVKGEIGSHVLVVNCSSLAPEERISNYSEIPMQPHSLLAHRLNLAVMQLSYEEGVSLVDVDRLIAEVGGEEHVTAPLDYSSVACRAIAEEWVRIAADYGFFDERPLLPQMSRTALT